jgi:predicted  nucleic acid-binding Zn-ribbon protein
MLAAQEQRQQTAAGLDAKLYGQYQKVAAQYSGRGVAQLQEASVVDVISRCHRK